MPASKRPTEAASGGIGYAQGYLLAVAYCFDSRAIGRDAVHGMRPGVRPSPGGGSTGFSGHRRHCPPRGREHPINAGLGDGVQRGHSASGHNPRHSGPSRKDPRRLSCRFGRAGKHQFFPYAVRRRPWRATVPPLSSATSLRFRRPPRVQAFPLTISVRYRFSKAPKARFSDGIPPAGPLSIILWRRIYRRRLSPGHYGNYETRLFEGAGNLPIVGEALAIRLAGQYQKRDGTRNIGIGNDLPPGGPSLITRVLRLNIPARSPAQARRA